MAAVVVEAAIVVLQIPRIRFVQVIGVRYQPRGHATFVVAL